jgi:ribosomal protein L16 Arg81 hydroxylase
MTGEPSIAVVADNIRRGATIRVRDIQIFDSRLDRVVGEIQRYFAAQSQINVYLTPPTKHGLALHFDTTDVFIVQCTGQKEWKIFSDYTHKIELPLIDTQWNSEIYKPQGAAETIVLTPGDVLYIPRGVMHEAFCTERESIHLTISIEPLTVADLLAREIRRIAAIDVDLRRRVPWTIDGDDSHWDELTKDVRQRVLKLADEIDVREALKGERNSFRQNPAASASELESAIASLSKL